MNIRITVAAVLATVLFPTATLAQTALTPITPPEASGKEQRYYGPLRSAPGAASRQTRQTNAAPQTPGLSTETYGATQPSTQAYGSARPPTGSSVATDALPRFGQQPSTQTTPLPPLPGQTDLTGQRPALQAVDEPSVSASAENPDGLRVKGTATALDGDTMIVDGRMVRLDYVDAPDLRQTCSVGPTSWECGRKAHARLASLIEGRLVACVGRAWSGQALVAHCQATGVGDLGKALVREGMAVVRRDLFKEYASEETAARKARVGLWVGRFDAPWRGHPNR